MAQLKEAFRITVKLAAAIDIGSVPGGLRRVIPILGGTFEGEQLRGEVLPLGADWNLFQPNTIMFVSARFLLKTEDGVIISILNEGWAQADPVTMATLMVGEPAPEEHWYCMLHPRFEAPVGQYQWLNERTFVCEMLPALRLDTMMLIIWEVTR